MPAQITTSETLVNTATTGDQMDPTVTVLSDGGWVVVWMGRAAIGSEIGIFAQRYDSAGSPVGGEFQVNSASADQWEGGPSVAALPDGGWVVTWYATSPHGGPSPEDAIVYMQRYDSTGATVGNEVQVNAPDGYTGLLHPDVTVLADGGWVIVWMSQHSGTDADEDIYGQRFNAAGLPVGTEFQVNSSAAGSQHLPSVTALDDGGWIVTWMSPGQDGSGWGVYAQRYNADGTSNGGETLVTTTTAGNQLEPHLATLADGGWVITWQSSGQDGSGYGIFAQRYDSGGAPVGGEFQVNTTTANDQLYATVDALSDGGFAVTWLSITPGSDPYGGRVGNVYVQRYDAAGNAVGGEILVGTASEGSFSNLDTRVAALSDGSLVVTWGQYGTDGSGYGVYARTFDAPTSTINGTEGDDVIVGTPGEDIINGLGGNDVLIGLASGDTLDGGNGTDTVSYADAAGSVDLNLGAGFADEYASDEITYLSTDSIVNFENAIGSEFRDGLVGSDGNNVLLGLGGEDSMHGGVGDDLLEGGADRDHLDGGEGTDTISYANAEAPVEVNLEFGFANEYAVDEVTILSSDHVINNENVTGSAFADVIVGSSAANALDGGGGDDLIVGLAGDDVLTGGDGNDLLRGDGFNNYTGPSGNDIVSGGSGDDIMWTSAGVDSYDGGEGFDRVSFFSFSATQAAVASLVTQTISNDGFGNAETMTSVEALGAGTAYADQLTGNNADNFLLGDFGDTLVANGGDDQFQLSGAPALTDGGAGTDTITRFTGDVFGSIRPDSNGDDLAELVFATRGVHVDLSLGMIVDDAFGNSGALAGIENVGGSGLGDILIGDGNANVLTGYGGNDVLEGRGGNDTLDGGDGFDMVSYHNASDAVQVNLATGQATGADGNDSLIGIEQVFGSEFGDVLIGDGGVNGLIGAGGDDEIFGGDGNDTLDGGEGNDFLVGDLGDDHLLGGSGSGSDTLQGLAGNDTLEGGDGDDLLFGDGGINYNGPSGNDVLIGGNGNDFLRGGAGVDSYDGGDGFDRVSFIMRAATQGVVASLVTQTITNDGFGNAETMTSIEGLGAGTAFADHLTGDENNNLLLGAVGDTLIGNGGNDDFDVASAPALISGGMGTDLLRLTTNGTWLLPDGGDPDDLAELAPAATSGWFVNLGSGALVDGYGNSGTVTDVENVEGSGLTDGLVGDGNANVLKGMDGDDFLFGGTGADVLHGGHGNDVIAGGTGADRFVIEDASGDDRITDFTNGVDLIAFAAASGVDSFSDLTFTKVGKNVLVSWGTDDSLLLEGVKLKDLDPSDFLFGG